MAQQHLDARRGILQALVLYYYRRMPQPAARKFLAEEQGMLFPLVRPARSDDEPRTAAYDAIKRLSELRFEPDDL